MHIPSPGAITTPIQAQQRIRLVSHATTQRSLFATPETVKPAQQLDARPLAEKRASYIRGRAEARYASGVLLSPQGKVKVQAKTNAQAEKKSGLGVGGGAGAMPEPQSSAPTLMVHIPNSALDHGGGAGDDGAGRYEASNADDEGFGDAGRTDDWVTVPGSDDTESGTSASSPRRLPLPPFPLPKEGLRREAASGEVAGGGMDVNAESPTRSTRDLRTKSWLMTAVGRMWGEERDRGKDNEVEDGDVESGRASEAGAGTEARLSVDGGMGHDGYRDVEDRRFISVAAADSGRPAFL